MALTRKPRPIEKEKIRHHMIYLSDYCLFAKEHDVMSATEWSNGEGYTIEIDATHDKRCLQLTHGEFDALKALLKSFNAPTIKPGEPYKVIE
jgi:hypothetical protein